MLVRLPARPLSATLRSEVAVSEDLIVIVGITMLCMLSPGPDMILVMQSTLAGDRRQGLLTSLGVLTGNLVHISYCALGFGYVVAHSIVAYSVLKLAGALYLIYLGVRSLRAALHAPDGEAFKVPSRDRVLSAYRRGLFNNLLNPKGALFYLGVFSQVITPETPTPRALVLIATMLSTSAAFWLLFVATLHRATVRSLIERSRRWVGAAFGALLVLLGLRIAAEP